MHQNAPKRTIFSIFLAVLRQIDAPSMFPGVQVQRLAAEAATPAPCADVPSDSLISIMTISFAMRNYPPATPYYNQTYG